MVWPKLQALVFGILLLSVLFSAPSTATRCPETSDTLHFILGTTIEHHSERNLCTWIMTTPEFEFSNLSIVEKDAGSELFILSVEKESQIHIFNRSIEIKWGSFYQIYTVKNTEIASDFRQPNATNFTVDFSALNVGPTPINFHTAVLNYDMFEFNFIELRVTYWLDGQKIKIQRESDDKRSVWLNKNDTNASVNTRIKQKNSLCQTGLNSHFPTGIKRATCTIVGINDTSKNIFITIDDQQQIAQVIFGSNAFVIMDPTQPTAIFTCFDESNPFKSDKDRHGQCSENFKVVVAEIQLNEISYNVTSIEDKNEWNYTLKLFNWRDFSIKKGDHHYVEIIDGSFYDFDRKNDTSRESWVNNVNDFISEIEHKKATSWKLEKAPSQNMPTKPENQAGETKPESPLSIMPDHVIKDGNSGNSEVTTTSEVPKIETEQSSLLPTTEAADPNLNAGKGNPESQKINGLQLTSEVSTGQGGNEKIGSLPYLSIILACFGIFGGFFVLAIILRVRFIKNRAKLQRVFPRRENTNVLRDTI